MKHHCYYGLLLSVFNRLLQISQISDLEMRRMSSGLQTSVKTTVLSPL